MAVTIKKNAKQQEVVPGTKPAYMSDEVWTEVQKLAPEVQAKFSAVNELSTDLIEGVAESVPDSLMELLITELESKFEEQTPTALPEPAPAQEVIASDVPQTDEAARKAARDALKAEIAGASKTPATVQASTESPAVSTIVTDAAPTMPAALALWDQLFPVGQAVTIVNRGNGKFELHIGEVKVKAEPASKATAEPTKKAKRVSSKSVSNNPAFWTEEYKNFMKDMKETYPTLPDRIARAESLGLVRGTDWVSKTKEGKAMPAAIENMYVMDAIRNKLGVEIYIEGARTKEERRAIADGVVPAPVPAT